MTPAQELYKKLKEDFHFENAQGSVRFNINDFHIVVEQNDIIGNIVEEWLGKWMNDRGIPNIHNEKQESPDFWLNPDDLNSDWLEVKSFMGSPGFDIAAFRSFINLIIDKPYKLQSDYLLIKYTMNGGVVTIDKIWLKKVWEICCTSERFPIKVQYKNKAIFNIRPATWYSERAEFKPFESLEDFLAALEQTIYKYHDTNHLAENWSDRLIKSYKNHYGVELEIPRWNDIKSKYIE